MIHIAVIMAAGLGTRFGKRTEKIPKGFIPVGGKPMVVRSIETLVSCGITRIVIGTGFGKEAYEALAGKFPGIECIFSPRYAETNSMYTLYNCRDILGDDDFLLLESDIIYNKAAIEELIEDKHPDIMLITPVTKFQDQYYVAHDEAGMLTNCSIDKTAIDAQGELVGIHKLSSAFYKRMCLDYASKVDACPKLGYEYELLYMSQHLISMFVLNSQKAKWYEIDDESDLLYAEKHVVPFLD
ncbi:MAG: phosphocholine cytidylyltransferase family protein [Bacteroidales bacterium]|nr:phosphocholine cytidylyltransferase family protein [Bacteroidales bacterium]